MFDSLLRFPNILFQKLNMSTTKIKMNIESNNAIPSNLRLFRGEDIELELQESIDGRIKIPKFEKITEPITPNCFFC